MDRRELLEIVEANTIFSFSRSAGAGGQNVNKVNTRVTARLPLSALAPLGAGAADLLEERLAGRINAAGELVVHVQEERSQLRNREIARLRLQALISGALVERKHRRPTGPSRGAKVARLDAKRRRGRLKALRRRGDPDGDG